MILKLMQSEWYKSYDLKIWLVRARLYALYLQKIGFIQCEEGAGKVFVDPTIKWVLEPGSKIIVKKAEVPLAEPWITSHLNGTFIGGFPIWQYLNPPVSRRTTIRIKRNASLLLNANVLICRGTYISIWPDQILSLGTNTYVGHQGYINTKMSLTIGSGTMIGHGTTIMDYDGHPIVSSSESATHQCTQESYGGKGEQIRIGSDCWIGFESAILKGAKVGNGAIVGAHSVVTDLRPKASISAGNPAKTIKEGLTWKRF
jgi:acetyltransferase-like isoleucine patch superfamily enzyme